MKHYLYMILALGIFSPQSQADFQSLNQLVGQCWQATFPDGKKVDTHCFSAVYGGAFIKDEHVVCGPGEPYYGETWYVYDSKKQLVTYRYYNSLGGISDGSVTFKDQQLVFPDETYQQGEQSITYRTTWSLAKDQYTSDMLQQDPSHAEGWKPVWQMVFKPIDLAQQDQVQFNRRHELHCHQ